MAIILQERGVWEASSWRLHWSSCRARWTSSQSHHEKVSCTLGERNMRRGWYRADDGQSLADVPLYVSRKVILQGTSFPARINSSIMRVIIVPLQHCLKKEALHNVGSKKSPFCLHDSSCAHAIYQSSMAAIPMLIFFPKVVLEKIPPWKLVALQIYSNFSFRKIPSIVTTHYPSRTNSLFWQTVFPFNSTVNTVGDFLMYFSTSAPWTQWEIDT